MGTRSSECIAMLCLITGLTIAGIWTDIVGYSANLLPADLAAAPESFNRDAYLWGRLVAGIIFIIFARRILSIQSMLTVSLSIIMSAATGAVIISYHQTLFDPQILSAICVFITGGTYVFLVSLFYILFAQRIKTEKAVLCIALSLVLELILSVIISVSCPASIQAGIVISAPVGVAVFYFLSERFSQISTLGEVFQKVQGRSKYFLLAQVIIISAVLVIIRTLSNVGVWGNVRNNFIGIMELSVVELAVIAGLILLMSYVVFILPKKHLNLQARCVLGLIVLLTGLQILAFNSDIQLGYSFDTITNATELFAHLVFWMIVIAAIRQTDVPPFRVVSISHPTYALISLVWVHYIEPQEFMNSAFVMLVMYILLIGVSVMLISGGTRKNQNTSFINEETNQVEIENFKRRWGLSQRETEIFSLLLDGKKRKEIEETCDLAQGTVKTHISSIYRKLDVHSKGEMIALFNKKDTAPFDEIKQKEETAE